MLSLMTSYYTTNKTANCIFHKLSLYRGTVYMVFLLLVPVAILLFAYVWNFNSNNNKNNNNSNNNNNKKTRPTLGRVSSEILYNRIPEEFYGFFQFHRNSVKS